MHTLTDEQLMSLLINDKGNRGRQALDILYQRYAQKMLSFFYFTMHNNMHQAKDLLHDLFLKIMEKKQSFDTRLSFNAWIYRVATNQCNNEFRDMKVSEKYTKQLLYENSNTVEHESHDETLRTCIASLNNEQRSLIVLRFKMKLSVKEIAQILDIPEGTVKSRLFYATKELSQLFKN